MGAIAWGIRFDSIQGALYSAGILGWTGSSQLSTRIADSGRSMIVYGDPGYGTTLRRLLTQFADRLDGVQNGDSDRWRALLIAAGQVEQAVADAPGPDTWLARCMALTDATASALLGHGGAGFVHRMLAALAPPPDLPVWVKIPEGYAFYTLFPELFAVAAERWSKDHARARGDRVLIVGIRSIGTSLSAVVAQALANRGWPVSRLSVRPVGHPSRRMVKFPAEAARGAAYGLIVDEGPGQSGSSMAAAAQALADSGMAAGRISFFPGHSGEPGPSGSEPVRHWWTRTRRYVAGIEEPFADGRTLRQILADRLRPAVVRVEDLSAGRWRRAVWPNPRDWPAAFAAFERSKFRMTRDDDTAVLWKFEGLEGGAEHAWDRLTGLAKQNWTAFPVDLACGFVATPWLCGHRPVRSDREVQRVVGGYLVAAAGPQLTCDQQRAARNRLRELLFWNIWESLGENAAEQSRRWDVLEPEADCRSYGDGRLGPEEWLQLADGSLRKVDCAGHWRDHTVIGPQPLIWDLAGALVEWKLHGQAARPLVEGFLAAGGALRDAASLEFYRMAYAAFRLGQCVMCDGATADPAEHCRLGAAAEGYRAELCRWLRRPTRFRKIPSLPRP